MMDEQKVSKIFDVMGKAISDLYPDINWDELLNVMGEALSATANLVAFSMMFTTEQMERIIKA